MKKLLSLIIISLFVMSGLVFADSSWTYENVTILGPRMGAKGQTPPVEVIKVTVGSADDAMAVGDVMTWGIESHYTDGNALGFKVDKARRGSSEDPANCQTAVGYGPYAGVMITIATSNDQGSGTTWSQSTPALNTEAIGYMAIRGFVDAKVDVSQATLSDKLVLAGHKNAGYFCTLGGVSGSGTSYSQLSEDIGYLMEKASSDGLMKVWLR